MKIGVRVQSAAVLAIITIIGPASGSSAGGINGSINLPKTGQTSCYGSSGNKISCTSTGQDGERQAGVDWPNPRFVANADGTITDALTGLIWAQNGNILISRDPQWEKRSTVIDGSVNWQHGFDYIAKLNAENYLGHNDWRMPNITELESVLNRNEINAAKWLNSQGFINVESGDYYWSSTSFLPDTRKAWVVDMSYSSVHDFDKTNSHFVWPVRGGR